MREEFCKGFASEKVERLYLIAVGGSHLLGKSGIISLLSKRGYLIKKLNLQSQEFEIFPIESIQ